VGAVWPSVSGNARTGPFGSSVNISKNKLQDLLAEKKANVHNNSIISCLDKGDCDYNYQPKIKQLIF